VIIAGFPNDSRNYQAAPRRTFAERSMALLPSRAVMGAGVIPAFTLEDPGPSYLSLRSRGLASQAEERSTQKRLHLQR
jgi:hypothetical protein